MNIISQLRAELESIQRQIFICSPSKFDSDLEKKRKVAKIKSLNARLNQNEYRREELKSVEFNRNGLIMISEFYKGYKVNSWDKFVGLGMSN